MPKYISPLNVIKDIEKCGMRNRLGGHQFVYKSLYKTYYVIVFIQMELNFHKINSFFGSIDHLIIIDNVQQCGAQVLI
jgi:hypothetical protein